VCVCVCVSHYAHTHTHTHTYIHTHTRLYFHVERAATLCLGRRFTRSLLPHTHACTNTQPPPPAAPEEGAEAQPDPYAERRTREKEDDYWEETFRSHTDKKPYGTGPVWAVKVVVPM
jgi:hypothetical protein